MTHTRVRRWGRNLPIFLGIVCGLVACSEAPLPLATGRQPIVNGTRSPQEVPMTLEQQLAIGWLHSPSTPEAPFCTGTLITSRHVITAAHCTAQRGPDGIGFGLGSDPAQPKALIQTAQIFTHPQLDVALLDLTETGDAALQRACMAEPCPRVVPIAGSAENLESDYGRALINTAVEAAGFGETLDPERTGLWFVKLPLVEINAEYVVVDGQGERGLCRGDSGGPVLTVSRLGAPVILGIEHGGSDDCVGRDSLTRLDIAAPWLRQVLSGAIRPDDAPAGCGDLDFNGRCFDDVVHWCNEDHVPVERDCRLEGATCGWAGTELGFYCISLEQSCDEVAAGTCLDGRVRRFCFNGVVTDDDCFKAGLRCAEHALGADCVDDRDAPVPPKRTFTAGCEHVPHGPGPWLFLGLWWARKRLF